MITEVGLSPSEIILIPVGIAMAILNRKRELDYDKFRVEEIRLRRLCYYSSSWFNHKGKTPEDLYPIIGEGKEVEAMDKDTANMAALELQKRLDGKKEGKGEKKAKRGSGFEALFGKR